MFKSISHLSHDRDKKKSTTASRASKPRDAFNQEWAHSWTSFSDIIQDCS